MGTSFSWNRWRCRSVGAWLAALLFTALAVAAAAPQLEAIYPSGSVVPANHLKFYLHFSEPMREGVFLDFCRLLDENGAPVAEPFRETELWSEDHRRLTLWLHPGRQKTGVNLNEEFGPILRPERRYTLLVSGAWPSQAGPGLGADVRKDFRAIARATAQLDPRAWRIVAPTGGTLAPLEIRFPYPLDHALLRRCLSVVNEAETAVPGAIETADEESTWRFTPRQAWRPAAYRILVESILEDLAGNSLARPFEVDLNATPAKTVPRVVELPFQPIAAPR